MMRALLALALVCTLGSLPARADAPRVAVTAVAATPADAQAAAQLAALARAALLEAEGFSFDTSLRVLSGDVTAALEAHGQAREALQRGRQAYLALELTQARAELERAMELWPLALAVLDSPEAVSETLLYLGASCVLSGDAPCAERAFARQQASFAELEPDARVFNPAIVAAWQRARRPLARTSLQVESSQPDAEIALDGLVVGLGSYRSDRLAPGAHWLRVTLPGARPWLKRLDVPAQAVTRVDVPVLAADPELVRALGGARDAAGREALRRVLGADALMVLEVASGPEGLLLTPHALGGSPSQGRQPVQVGAGLAERASTMRMVMADFLEQVARRAHEQERLASHASPQRETRADARSGAAWYRRAWVWTVVGVALAAGVTGTVLLVRAQDDAPPADDRASLTLQF